MAASELRSRAKMTNVVLEIRGVAYRDHSRFGFNLCRSDPASSLSNLGP